ncbi:hypothetical protein HMPREF1870_00115 [Bacteroidales bacterium KA00344]|nr:hypothetical protein HMPREF1870_00115 [Bacteroidales bacterium KA00344]
MFTKNRCFKTLLPDVSIRLLQGKIPDFANLRHNRLIAKTA